MKNMHSDMNNILKIFQELGKRSVILNEVKDLPLQAHEAMAGDPSHALRMTPNTRSLNGKWKKCVIALAYLLCNFMTQEASATYTQAGHQAHSTTAECGNYENGHHVITLTGDGTISGSSFGIPVTNYQGSNTTLHDPNCNGGIGGAACVPANLTDRYGKPVNGSYKNYYYPYFASDGYVAFNPNGNPNILCPSPVRQGADQYGPYEQDRVYEMYEHDALDPGDTINSFFRPEIRIINRYCIGAPVYYPTCGPWDANFWAPVPYLPVFIEYLAVVSAAAAFTGSNLMWPVGSCWKWGCAGGMVAGDQDLTVNECQFVGTGSIVRYCARPAPPGVENVIDYQNNNHTYPYNSLGNHTAVEPDYRGPGKGNRFAGPLAVTDSSNVTTNVNVYTALELASTSTSPSFLYSSSDPKSYLIIKNGVVVNETAHITVQGVTTDYPPDSTATAMYIYPGGTAYSQGVPGNNFDPNNLALEYVSLKSTHKVTNADGVTSSVVNDTQYFYNGRVVNPRPQLCAYEDSGDAEDMAGSNYNPYHYKTPNPAHTNIVGGMESAANGGRGRVTQGLTDAAIYFAPGVAAIAMGVGALVDAITATLNQVVEQDLGCVDFVLGPYPPRPTFTIPVNGIAPKLEPICAYNQTPLTPPTNPFDPPCVCPNGDLAAGGCVAPDATHTKPWNTFEKPRARIGFSQVTPYCKSAPVQRTTQQHPCACSPSVTTDCLHPTFTGSTPDRVVYQYSTTAAGVRSRSPIGIMFYDTPSNWTFADAYPYKSPYADVDYDFYTGYVKYRTDGMSKPRTDTSTANATLPVPGGSYSSTYFIAMDDPTKICLYLHSESHYCTSRTVSYPTNAAGTTTQSCSDPATIPKLNSKVGSCIDRLPTPSVDTTVSLEPAGGVCGTVSLQNTTSLGTNTSPCKTQTHPVMQVGFVKCTSPPTAGVACVDPAAAHYQIQALGAKNNNKCRSLYGIPVCSVVSPNTPVTYTPTCSDGSAAPCATNANTVLTYLSGVEYKPYKCLSTDINQTCTAATSGKTCLPCTNCATVCTSTDMSPVPTEDGYQQGGQFLCLPGHASDGRNIVSTIKKTLATTVCGSSPNRKVVIVDTSTRYKVDYCGSSSSASSGTPPPCSSTQWQHIITQTITTTTKEVELASGDDCGGTTTGGTTAASSTCGGVGVPGKVSGGTNTGGTVITATTAGKLCATVSVVTTPATASSPTGSYTTYPTSFVVDKPTVFPTTSSLSWQLPSGTGPDGTAADPDAPAKHMVLPDTGLDALVLMYGYTPGGTPPTTAISYATTNIIPAASKPSRHALPATANTASAAIINPDYEAIVQAPPANCIAIPPIATCPDVTEANATWVGPTTISPATPSVQVSGTCTMGTGSPTRYCTAGTGLMESFAIWGTITGSCQVLPVPGAVLWLDASDPLYNSSPPANGTAISTWKDKSGNGYDFTTLIPVMDPIVVAMTGHDWSWYAAQGGWTNPYTSPTYHSTGLNGQGVVHFNGTSDGLYYDISSNHFINTNFTIFVVFSNSTGVGSNDQFYGTAGLLSAEKSGQRYDFGMGLSADGHVVAGDGAFDNDQSIATTNSFNHTSAHVATFTRKEGSASTSDVISVAVDGTSSNTFTYDHGDGGTFNNPDQLVLGAQPDNENYLLTGDIAEVVVYASVLTSAQIKQELQYLSQKWGTPLPPP